MSNDDDRMDRAKRIREMREGSREEDSDEEAADGGEPEPDGTESNQNDEAEEEAEAEDDETAADDESAEKQTMEDLVESAAADADDEAEELDLDDGLSVDDELDEMDDIEAEEEVVAEVEDAVSDDSTDDPREPEMTETDDTTETEPQAEDDGDDNVTAPLPDTETLEDALEEGDGDEEVETVAPEGEEEMPAAPGAEETETQQEETRVLEFRLDDEYYCLDIAYIEEIVKEETITRVPNTPEYVQGVVDLRGQITTILNPKVTLGKDDTGADQLIVVFDSEAFEDQGHIGWVVDDVRQVSPITDSEVNDPPVEDDHINGVIDRDDDDQFVIWTSPELALEEADG